MNEFNKLIINERNHNTFMRKNIDKIKNAFIPIKLIFKLIFWIIIFMVFFVLLIINIKDLINNTQTDNETKYEKLKLKKVEDEETNKLDIPLK